MAAKQKLVVIGNGMAGVRAVEEILARGGADRFEITIFGEEPYGNYNRILLSDVLNGSHEPEDIFLNPLAWYADNCGEIGSICNGLQATINIGGTNWTVTKAWSRAANDCISTRTSLLAVCTGMSDPLLTPQCFISSGTA